MKLKHSLRIISLLVLLVSIFASQTSALAAAPEQASGPTATIHLDSSLTLTATPTLKVGDTVTYAIDLQNLPAEGLTSADFSCRYDPVLAEISGLADAGLFGSDAISTVNGPAGGTFVFAIAGVSKKATVGGTVFRFNLKGLKVGSFIFDCKVRASKGTDLFDIAFTPATITINDVTSNGTVNGKVIASKAVTVTLLSGSTVIASAVVAADGSFSLTAPAGSYSITATASGFLKAVRSSITLTAGGTLTMPTINLLAGDINADDKIDATDVLTIGINYNKSTPTAADFNNDGTINLLDLQTLAKSYPRSAASAW